MAGDRQSKMTLDDTEPDATVVTVDGGGTVAGAEEAAEAEGVAWLVLARVEAGVVAPRAVVVAGLPELPVHPAAKAALSSRATPSRGARAEPASRVGWRLAGRAVTRSGSSAGMRLGRDSRRAVAEPLHQVSQQFLARLQELILGHAPGEALGRLREHRRPERDRDE